MRFDLGRAVEGDEPGRRLLEIILKESQRLDRTIKGFLRFARPRDSSLVRFDVVELLREHFALLSNSEEVGDRHRLRLDVEEEPVMMVADADQLSQICWNLSRNALRAIGALERFEEFEQGINTEVRERGSRLSAGERQLVSLARAALVDPAVLVLDEATSNLDPGTEAIVEHALENLMGSRTTIIALIPDPIPTGT